MPHDAWTSWSFDALVVASLALSAFIYTRGVHRLWNSAGRGRGVTVGQRARFWTGWIVLAVALVSPVHAIGSLLFSVHMTQHELLMVVAAPLLVTSQPLVASAWAFERTTLANISQWRIGHVRVSHAANKAWQRISTPAVALAIHVVAVLAWHLPALYQATLRSDAMHALQHASFFMSAIAFWWGLLRARREAAAAGVAYLFIAMMITGVFGALLTFARELWYPAYAATAPAWGVSAIDDQRLGGMIMWIPGGLSYLGAALWLMGMWLREDRARVDTKIVGGRG